MTQWPNWVDLVVVTITLKMCYGGYVRGVVAELLYVVGALAMTLLSVGYWERLAGWLQPWVAFPFHLVGALSFVVLFLSLWVVVRVAIRSFTQIMKWERVHWLLQSIGLALGAARGFWWSGFFVLVLNSAGFVYLRQSVEERSLAGPRLAEVSKQAMAQLLEYVPGSTRGTFFPSLIPSKK